MKKSADTETGLDDFHKFISTRFKAYFSELCPKIIYYRNYKFFRKIFFLEDPKKVHIELKIDVPDENDTILPNAFSDIVRWTCPFEKKIC